jgi:hypothetical protein
MFNNARTLLYELHCWYAVYSVTECDPYIESIKNLFIWDENPILGLGEIQRYVCYYFLLNFIMRLYMVLKRTGLLDFQFNFFGLFSDILGFERIFKFGF